MEKFFYKHFGDDVPAAIENEYNRLLIQEYNQNVREYKNRVQTLDFYEVSEFFPDPASLPMYELEVEKERLHRQRLEYLPKALQLLKIEYPDLYELVIEYFFAQDKVTMASLAEVHAMSVDKIRYRIGLAKVKLREYYDLHEKKV